MKKKIENVRYYIPIENNLFIVDMLDNLIYNNKILKTSILGIAKKGNHFFSYEFKNGFINTYHFINENLESLESSVIVDTFDGVNAIIEYDYDSITKDFQIALFDILQKKIVYKLPYRYNIGPSIRINNNIFHIKQNKYVTSLYLETGEYLWETDISNFVSSLDGFSYKDERVGGILGISDNKLIITVGTRLLKIDLHNGIITGDTEALSHGKNYSQGPAGFHSYLHLEDEYVYLLKRDRYLRISLITGKLETLWVNSQSDLIIEHVHYDENYAYFMACIGWNLQPEVLGVFDRKNLSIVWQYDQPIYSSQPPQSDGKKLYSLDTGGTLHIFERAI